MVNTRSSGKVKKKISLDRKVCDKLMRIKATTSKRYNSKKASESVKKRRRFVDFFVKEKLKDFEPLIAVDNRFLGKLNFTSSHSVINDIKQILSPVQLDMFRKSCFGYFLDLNGMKMQHKLFHSLLLREVYHSNKMELWFDVRGKKLRFGIFEFATVTGLRCTGDESRFSSASAPDGLFDTYFKHEKKINRVLIEKMFKSSSFSSDDEAVKFAKLYFTQCFLLSSHENTKVEERFIHLVDSDLCDEYLWGKYCFEKTVESMKHRLASRAKRSHDESDFYYRLYGLPYSVQIWFYECLTSVPAFLCNLENHDRIPRMLRWTPRDISMVRNSDYIIFEDAYEKLELKNISASQEEVSVLHLDGLSEQGVTTYDVPRENLKDPNLGLDDVHINPDDNLGSSSGLIDKRITAGADFIPVSMLFDFMKDVKDVIVKEIGGLKEFTEKRLASVVQKIDSIERRAFQEIDTDKSAEVGVNFTLNDTFHCGSTMNLEKEDADAENLDDDHMIYDKPEVVNEGAEMKKDVNGGLEKEDVNEGSEKKEDVNEGSDKKDDMADDDADKEFDVSVFTSETEIETDAVVGFKSE